MAARLVLLITFFIAIVSAQDLCNEKTDCYSCLKGVSCSWCPTTKVCSATTIHCNVTLVTPPYRDTCPCTDPSRNNCFDCQEGITCAWCITDKPHSCMESSKCLEYDVTCNLGGLAGWIIACIIVGSILVVLVPVVIIIICCCCVAGTAAAVASAERQSLVPHGHTSTSSATVIYSQPGYPQTAPPPYAQPPAYPQPTYQ